MRVMNPSTAPAPRFTNSQRALLAIVPALCVVVGYLFLPRPESAVEARTGFDRAKLQDVLLSSKPQGLYPVDAVLGNKIRILGSRLPDAPLQKGDSINVEVYFEALREMDRNWKMFVHIDRDGATYRIHGDHWPADGAYPTSYWQKKDIVRDALDKRVPLDAPPGNYVVYMGFYIGDERLPFSGGDKKVHDGSNRVRVGQFKIQ